MKQRTALVLFFLLGTWLLATPAQAQAPPDYLTEEEVQKVRETQEPNDRIALFLAIAADRLAQFEKGLAANPPAHTDDLTELIDAYISAIDDATNNLEIWLERGGVKLGKARAAIE
ncbi:MAG: hypothetical protein HY653_05895, partial [Acidobacteria bacterium]|nr:hypothetical protein [Acidobacteriota bacterium]